MTRPRLADGYHLFPMSDGQWLLFGPDDLWCRITADPDRMHRLATGLRAGARGDQVDFQALGVQDLLAELASSGLLAEGPAGGDDEVLPDRTGQGPAIVVGDPSETITIWLAGDGAWSRVLHGMLTALALNVRGWPRDSAAMTPKLPEAAQDGDVLLDLRDWQANACWQQLDTLCRDRRLAWYGGYSEGRRLFAGPLWTASHGTRFRDLRDRQIASADHAPELLAYLDYLDAGNELPKPPTPTRAALAHLCAAIAGDLLAHVEGRHPEQGALWQHSIGIDGGEPARHPILPVPRDCAT